MTRERILAAMTINIERSISNGETPREIAERLLLIPEIGRAAETGLDPAQTLSAAADYLDDGFHDRIVADLREIVEGGTLEPKPA